MTTPQPTQSPDRQPRAERRFPLFRKRQCTLPTWRGWLVLLGILILATWLFIKQAYPFLAVSVRVPSKCMVIEGWATDSSMEAAAREFLQGNYETLYVVGVPLDRGVRLSEYESFAHLGKAILLKLGVPETNLVAVPAPYVPQDRTYTCYKALREHLDSRGSVPDSMLLISEGAHARRSRLMAEWTMGENCRIGILALPPQGFIPERWWTTSSGFKHVVTEALSYLYARVLFKPA